MKKIKKFIPLIRPVISSMLLIDFIVVVLTAIGLVLAPSGRVAKESDWKFLIWDKWQLEKIHTLFGFIMVGLVVIHLFINWKMFKVELKGLFSHFKKKKLEK